MIWLYLSYAAILIGAIKLAMMLIMQIAGDINDIYLQNNFKRLSHKKGVFNPKVSVVMIAKNISSDFDMYVESVLGSTIQPNELVLFIDIKDRKTYNKLRYYRDKHGLGGYIKLVRYNADANVVNLIKKSCKGTYLVMLDGTALLTPKTLEKSLVMFRQESLQAVLTNNVPNINSSLKSGLTAVVKVVKGNYFRAQPISGSELCGVLIARKKSFSLLANNGMLLTKLNIPKSLKAKSNPIIIRNSLSLVKDIEVKHRFDINLATTLVWFADLAAFAGILYIRGSYEGWILIGFVTVLIMFLISIAIFGYRGLSFMNRINLILLAPIAYLSVYLLIMYNFVKILVVSFKNHIKKNSKNTRAAIVVSN